MALDNTGKEIIFQDLDSYSVNGKSCMGCRFYFNHHFPDNEPCASCQRCGKYEPISAEVEFPECDDYGYKLEPEVKDYVTPPTTQHFVDIVNHPPHYTSHPSGVECIQITEHMGFNLGNALKYIWRADLKWDRTEDIKKAIWYLNRELERKVDDDSNAA